MKAAQGFILREIAGDIILIPSGAAAQKFNGLITINELGAFIWDALQSETTLDAIVEKITEAYEVDAETARADAVEFLDELRKVGGLEDSGA